MGGRQITPSRLAQFCGHLIEAGWLVAMVVPLYFNEQSSRIFEADKTLVIRIIGLVIAVAGTVRLLELQRGGKPHWIRRRLAAGLDTARANVGLTAILLGVVLLAGSHIISTIFSVSPWVSVWGSFQRMQGLATVGAYLVLFASVATMLRTRDQLNRLVSIALVVSLPLSLYGIAQHFGLDPLIWSADVTRRAASTLGNPTFVGGFLIMVVPIAIIQLVSAKTSAARLINGSILLILLACIIFAQGRGAVIAMGVSLLLLILLVARFAKEYTRSTVIVAAGAIVVVLVSVLPAFNVLNSSGGEGASDYLRQGLETDSGSGRVRMLLWEGVDGLIASDLARMSIGYGPETVKLTLPAHIPAEIDRLNDGAISDRAHNDVFDILLTTGLFGLLAWITVVTGLVLWSLRTLGIVSDRAERQRFLLVWFGLGVAALIAVRILDGLWRLGGLAFAAGLIGGLLIFLAASASRTNPKPATQDRLLLVAILTSIIAHFLDVQIGVATTATRSYFWIFAGVVVAIGKGLEPANSSKSRPSFDASGLLVGWILATIAAGLVITTKELGNVWIGVSIVSATWVLAALIIPGDLPARQRLSRYGTGTVAVAGGYLLLRWLGIRGGLEMTMIPVLYLGCTVAMVAGIAFLLTSAEDKRGGSWNRRFGVLYVPLLAILGYGMFNTANTIRADVYLRASTYQMSMGESSLSLKAAHNAVRLDPKRSMYHLNLGNAYLRAGNFAEAEVALLAAQALSPLDPDHPANLGRLFQHWWQTDQSDPDSGGRVQRALVHFDRATHLNPNNPSLWNELALTHLIAGDTTASLSTLRHSLELDDEVAQTHIQMGNIYRINGELTLALASYRQALALDIRPQVRSALEQVIDQIESE
ncbi:tetratricopeptide repeat protein [Bacteroidota bacterium]